MEDRKGMDNFNKGHTQLPHKLGNVLLLIDLTEREQKVIYLLIRLTYGCQKRWAKLKFADLKVVGIDPPHVREVIEPLLAKEIVAQNGKTKEFRVNEEYLCSKVTEKVTNRLAKLGKLVGKQLKKNYQNSNQKVTEIVTTPLPKKEVSGYQNSNVEGLPRKEDLNSDNNDFATPKDILNKKLNKPIDKGFIGGNNSFKRSEQIRRVNPQFFPPQNETEYAAKYAWEQIEPDNPDSFRFYIWAVKQGLPTQKFYDFAAEIKNDRRIENKGAVFVTKVKKYLEGKDD